MRTNKSTVLRRADLSDAGVAAIIDERIRHGLYPPGSRIPSERELAAEFGVSRRFVRMAFDRLSIDGLVTKEYHRRPIVLLSMSAAREGRGESRMVFRSSGVDGTQPTVVKSIAAILPSHPVSPGGLAVIAGIHRVLTDFGAGYRMQLYDTYHASRVEMLRLESKALRAVAEQPNVEGLIWWRHSDEADVADFLNRRPGISAVFIDRLPSGPAVDFVGVDEVDSSRAAVEHLFELGHTRIAHVVDTNSKHTDRAAGYREAHITRNIPVDPMLTIVLDKSKGQLEQSLDRLLRLRQSPTAVIAANDYLAYEIVNAAEACGLAVPRDLSVIGYGNIDQFTLRQFLTTIEQPFEHIGRTAARLLLRRLSRAREPEGSTQHIIVQAPLIQRKSCASLRDDV